MNAVGARIAAMAPGLGELARYRWSDFRGDGMAGLSVAAVTIPVGMAYAQLAGFSPEVGLYSAILPLLVYALLGSSPQMIVGPDAATSALVAATLLPLATPGSEEYRAQAMSLTLLAGLFGMIAGRLRFGFLADFLSLPILAGLMNGVAINIVVSQLGKVTGLALQGRDLIGQLQSFAGQLSSIHLPTLAISAATLGIYFALKRLWPRGPAVLLALLGVALATRLLGLHRLGIATVGALPAGLPEWVGPSLPHETLGTLIPGAVGIALVSFSKSMLAARTFATRNGYAVDGNQEFFAGGAATFASALSQGFAVAGSTSRTALSDAANGRTRMVSIVAAATILLVLLFFTDALAGVPSAALSAILIGVAVGLIDPIGFMDVRRYSKGEYGIALVTLLGVVLLGVMPGILLAVAVALIRFLKQMARPAELLFGMVPGHDEFFELAHYPDARPVPGLLIYRFESPLTFFNAGYFKTRVIALAAQHQAQWVVIDAISIAQFDYTGAMMVRELQQALAARGVQLVIAGRTAQLLAWLGRRKIDPATTGIVFHRSRQEALQAYRARGAQTVDGA